MGRITARAPGNGYGPGYGHMRGYGPRYGHMRGYSPGNGQGNGPGDHMRGRGGAYGPD